MKNFTFLRSVYFLFANTLLDEISDIDIENLYNDNENQPKIPKDHFVTCLT